MQGFHAVQPKTDCPHCTPENIWAVQNLVDKRFDDPCFECKHVGENWICLKPGCAVVGCSRYVDAHMREVHAEQNPDHMIVFSFADFSYWCYECDSYIKHPLLRHTDHFYEQKFPPGTHPEDALVAIAEAGHEIDE